ncbi:MAG TPA: cystathionine gamma-synthase [Thermoanaerobaculia bacterium]|nr:cystathionine gamma-synthase [Thermoanaerobaculia bacterium]
MKGDAKGQGFATRAIHAGQEPDPITGAVAVPIYQTSTYLQDELGKTRGGNEYARVQNPTRRALEQLVASLEGGLDGHAFASGMSAIHTLMTLLESGDHAVVSQNVYGGTFRLFEQVLSRNGLHFSWVDTTDLDAVRAALTPRTRMIYVETPTNPLMEISDIAAIAEIAREADCVMVVDNTFLSPYHQLPLELGADVVIHSTTKYLNGHSDSVGGVLVSSRQEHADWFHFVSKSAGAILSPFDSFLVMRGIKTLPVRMARHEENARRVVEFLVGQEGIVRVLYPGLPDHPGHEVQQRQSRGFGAMVTADLGSYEAAKRMLDRVRVFSLAESLGGVESLISHPATMTHASVPAERRKRLGITEGMVRLSVGIEEADDLLADLDQALAD